MMNENLTEKLIAIANSYPRHQALWVNGRSFTYADLFNNAITLARQFNSILTSNVCCAILSDRNEFAYLSILAAFFSRLMFMPLNPNFPLIKTIRMISVGRPRIICIDSDNLNKIIKILNDICPNHIFLFKQSVFQLLKKMVPKHHYYYYSYKEKSSPPLLSAIQQVNSNDKVYLLFSSGTTGKPKGVAIRHYNLFHYINNIIQLFKPTIYDRFSQFSELTFDLSIHDMFVCWASGATLYILPDNYIFGVKRFIQKHQLTFWLSVPSIITLLTKFADMKPNCLPSLRRCFFCGESLLQSQAVLWQQYAPNAQITNLYGPTEATVACTYFNWQYSQSKKQSSVVPIGFSFPKLKTAIHKSSQYYLENAQAGELYLSGHQVITSYWNHVSNNFSSHEHFWRDEQQQIWYKTGDLIKWTETFGYIFIGRGDDQWKIRGYRINKHEIESEIRHIIKQNAVVAVVPVEIENIQISYIVAFIDQEIDRNYVLKCLRVVLPDVMVPTKIIILKNFPLNSNGKINYFKLQQIANTFPC